MRRARHDEVAHEIKEVRDLQRLSAEARAGKAASVLQNKEDALEHDVGEQHDLEERWQSAVSENRLPVEMARLWSAALLRQDERVQTAQQDVDLATEQLQRNIAELDAATKRRDEAQDRARKADSASLMRRDEERLVEVLDRHQQRWGEA